MPIVKGQKEKRISMPPSGEEQLFVKLRSDLPLLDKIRKMTFENDSDQKGVGFVLAQKDGLTANQREWLNTLIERRGKKYIKQP